MHPKSYSDWEHSGRPRCGDGIEWYVYSRGFSVAHRVASRGAFRVIGEDRKYYSDAYPIAEYSLLDEAIECASTHDTDDERFFVYDDGGILVWAPVGKEPDPEGHT
ncbi:MAG: hypothetical protein A2676_05215 [Candidatus Sungbacteria bacterium RIFCSPHIGHO2_01_FULL_51_22]|nr:MAG: hypothetical protein A2676_05215 [Candidatus Sungbacteria bacterium RIFCSPHIGHO2_01_FULL_51_22]